MKRIISLALLSVLGMHASMYAQELVIADQPVKATACWYGKDVLGFTYDCYFGELPGDGEIIAAMQCIDSKGHPEYFVTMVPTCRRPEGCNDKQMFDQLAAHHHQQYDAERYERTEIDGKAYQVTTIVPKDASPEFKAMVTEKANIKIAFCGIMNYIQSCIKFKDDIWLNIKTVDMPGVMSLFARFPRGDMQAYASKDPLSGALIVASAPEGLADMAEVILFHERTETVYHGAEEANAGLTFRAVKYPGQRVQNAQEVYTAMQKLYKERYADADRYAGALELF